MSIPEWLTDVQKSFRIKRMRRFACAVALTKSRRILDVGGTPEIWSLLPVPEDTRIVVINMPRAGASLESSASGFAYVHGDGCNLPFRDQSFDIVFSNSVIEHVGGPDAQARFAHEIRRTGRGYWVQTPNRYFPIETHLLASSCIFCPRGGRSLFAAPRLAMDSSAGGRGKAALH